MADYNKAFDNVIRKFEGGYAFDLSDTGGETFMGISRRYHPYWKGWKIIDIEKKRDKTFPSMLKFNSDLISSVKKFYRKRYWNIIKGDDLSQVVAERLFNIAINLGIKTAIKMLQASLNLLMQNGALAEDGILGPKTMQALNACLQNDDEQYLIMLLKTYQGRHYIQSCMSRPTNKRFIRGWLTRTYSERD